MEHCCKCWCSNTLVHSCQHTSIVTPKHSYIVLSCNFLGCHNLASEGLLFQMQSIFPYHSNNFSALLQEIKLNNSFSVENQYVPWHTRRKFTVQNYRILYDKAISTTTTNCTNEDITTISKRFTGITCTAYNHLRICVHTSSAIPHLLRPWISWDENKKSVVLNIALTIFLHFSSFLFLRCDMKTASDANLYRGS